MVIPMASCSPARVLAGVLCLLGGWALAAPAAAQSLFLPVEVGDGVLLPDGSPKPYVASARFHPALGFGTDGAVRIGPSFAAQFVNPGVSWQAGGRIQFLVKDVTAAGFSALRFDLAGEALWGTKDRNPVGGALIVGAGRVVQFTLRGGYDLEQEAGYFGASVGTDLSLWLGIHPRPRPTRPIPMPFTGCVFEVFVEARIQVLSSFEDDQGVRNEALIDGLRAFLDRQGDVFERQPDLAQARRLLEANGLEVLADQMDAVLDLVRAKPACREIGGLLAIDTEILLRAFREAWAEEVKRGVD